VFNSAANSTLIVLNSAWWPGSNLFAAEEVYMFFTRFW